MRFWMSWYDAEPDYRPLHDPPNAAILGWWNSGETMEKSRRVTLVVWIEAASIDAAKEILASEWPESATSEWRFTNEVSDSYRPTDRFPLPEWSAAKKVAS